MLFQIHFSYWRGKSQNSDHLKNSSSTLVTSLPSIFLPVMSACCRNIVVSDFRCPGELMVCEEILTDAYLFYRLLSQAALGITDSGEGSFEYLTYRHSYRWDVCMWCGRLGFFFYFFFFLRLFLPTLILD